MDEFILGIVKAETERVLYWDGVFNKEELQTRINSGSNLPDDFKIYRLTEVNYTKEKKVKTVEVDEITISEK